MQEEGPRIPMEKAGKILRKSTHTFLQNYQFFTSTVALIAFPFSASVLISQAYVPSSSLLPTIYNRLHSLFDSAGFPPSSELFTILNQKLSQTISSSIFTLPFTLTFLLVTKASIFQALNLQKPTLSSSSPPSFSSIISLYFPLLLTQIYNSFLILSANATVFSVLFIAFNFLQGFGFSSSNTLLFFSASGAVLYSIVLANELIICNLALVVSGTERSGGYLAILKACLLIRGRAPTALSLAVPLNMALAAIEALFQYRIVRPSHFSGKLGSSIALEGVLIAYLYSVLVVLDAIVSFTFFKSCNPRSSWVMDQEDGRRCCGIEYTDDDEESGGYGNFKTLKEVP